MLKPATGSPMRWPFTRNLPGALCGAQLTRDHPSKRPIAASLGPSLRINRHGPVFGKRWARRRPVLAGAGLGAELTANGFERFLQARRGDLRKISARTSGEYSTDDLMSEAWLMAIEIGRRRGWTLDFRDEDDQDTVLAWLHNRFVKYAEKAIRHAIRLDRDWDSEDTEQTGAALARLLTAPVDSDPQIRHQALNEQDDLIAVVRKSYSEAAAYVLLLVRVDWHLPDLAELLAIGRDALKHRLRTVGLRARVQPTLFDGIDQIDPDFQPRRRVRWIKCGVGTAQTSSQATLWT